MNSSKKTPNLDAMAKRDRNFTRSATNQPICPSARSVLMTSRYATETGVWRNRLALANSLSTIESELRSAGYTFNLIGKLHLSPSAEGDGNSLDSSSSSIAPDS